MKIGIDLSILQTGHRQRGIGSVVINFINHLSSEEKKNNHFVFFLQKSGTDDALRPLYLKGLSFEVRYIKDARKWPGKKHLYSRIWSNLLGELEYMTGDERIQPGQLSDIDSYIQFDQNGKLPKNSKKHTAIVLYDIIPYVMESEYLRSYSTARQKGQDMKSAIKCAILRYEYMYKLIINCRRAKNIIAISDHTKQDVVKRLGIDPSRISVSLLGSNPRSRAGKNSRNIATFSAYKSTVWGNLKQKVDLSKRPYLLYSGGADPRRQLVDLVAAYNNLRARGIDISLVLTGDTMYGPESIPNEALKRYFRDNPSYMDNVYFMGFVSDQERDSLYKSALVYIYPSLYEGFGLPILEAMSHGTPVITYNNSSIPEVAGDAVMYASGFSEIVSLVVSLLEDASIRGKFARLGEKRSEAFTWEATSHNILETIGEQS